MVPSVYFAHGKPKGCPALIEQGPETAEIRRGSVTMMLGSLIGELHNIVLVHIVLHGH